LSCTKRKVNKKSITKKKMLKAYHEGVGMSASAESSASKR